MNNPWIFLAVTTGLIGTSAFFVAVEFALIAARRSRLEDAAPHSRAARAALRSASELSVLLAGSQLGITVCTLALGAVTKPAVHRWLTPAFAGWGAPLWLADVAAFVAALSIVTFLHLVVGEMAPKSWAIAHPEKSATMLAIPMRGFMWVTRPVIVRLNHLANWCLRRVGVQPVDQVSTGQDPDTLRSLVEHSATVGTLDERYRGHLTRALELQALTVGDMVRPNAQPRPSTLDPRPSPLDPFGPAGEPVRVAAWTVEQERGLLRPVLDPADLAARVLALREDRGGLARYGVAGLRRVLAAYTVDHMARAWVALARAALDEMPPPSGPGPSEAEGRGRPAALRTGG